MLHSLLRRLRARWPVRYDGSFFTQRWFENWQGLAPVLAALLAHDGSWRTFLDYGCGPGIMIDWMNDRGFSYTGWDPSAAARALYLQHFGKYPERYVGSLEQAAAGAYDVMVSFDVFEHLHDEEIAQLLARPWQVRRMLANISREPGIPGHINIKRDAAWVDFFARHGWRLDEAGTEQLRALYRGLRPRGEDLWHQNMFLFAPRGS
jgi:SAM-dependent methyltransferase